MSEIASASKQVITQLLTPMDVPAMRRDLDKPENIAWLVRNLGINNSAHENYTQTMTLLVSLNGMLARPKAELPYNIGRNNHDQ